MAQVFAQIAGLVKFKFQLETLEAMLSFPKAKYLVYKYYFFRASAAKLQYVNWVNEWATKEIWNLLQEFLF